MPSNFEDQRSRPIAEAVYILCFLTSVAVALLLLRGYAKTRARILLWSGLGFLGLCLNNLLLIFDILVVPGVDMSMARGIPALAGLAILIYGLIFDSE